YRMVIDLSEVSWHLPDGQAPAGRGLVKTLRYGLFAPGTSRIVLDLAGPARLHQVSLLPASGDAPVRLVIDLEPADDAAFEAALRAGPVVSSAAMTAAPAALVLPPPKPESTDERAMIVIDPGHGGVDPG